MVLQRRVRIPSREPRTSLCKILLPTLGRWKSLLLIQKPMKPIYYLYAGIAIIVGWLLIAYYPTQSRIEAKILKEYKEKQDTLSKQTEFDLSEIARLEETIKAKKKTIEINNATIAKYQDCIDHKSLSCDVTIVLAAPEKQPTLREVLWIKTDCDRPLVFNEKHKLPRYNLEWLAYDIPSCDRQPMPFYAPDMWSWKTWTVEKIGVWTNMGNFIIIKETSSDFRLVFAHAVPANLKEWDLVQPKQQIWTTNISGESTWMHLHVEIWTGVKTASREIFWSNTYQTEDESDLLRHRNWNFWTAQATPASGWA